MAANFAKLLELLHRKDDISQPSKQIETSCWPRRLRLRWSRTRVALERVTFLCASVDMKSAPMRDASQVRNRNHDRFVADPSRRTARNALAPQPWRMKRRRGTQAVEGIKGGPETDGSARRSTKATATAMMAMC